MSRPNCNVLSLAKSQIFKSQNPSKSKTFENPKPKRGCHLSLHHAGAKIPALITVLHIYFCPDLRIIAVRMFLSSVDSCKSFCDDSSDSGFRSISSCRQKPLFLASFLAILSRCNTSGCVLGFQGFAQARSPLTMICCYNLTSSGNNYWHILSAYRSPTQSYSY